MTSHRDDVVLRSILRHHNVTSLKLLIERSCVRPWPQPHAFRVCLQKNAQVKFSSARMELLSSLKAVIRSNKTA